MFLDGSKLARSDRWSWVCWCLAMETVMNYAERDIYGVYRVKGHTQLAEQVELMAVNALIGSDVYNQRNVFLGDIKEIMLNVKTGCIAYVQLSIRGLLDLDGKRVAVPWSAFMFDAANNRLVVSMDRLHLWQVPDIEVHKWLHVNQPTPLPDKAADYGRGLD
ncbi:photosystem reaction center subunit H [Chromobacterium alticapitis]|uniref:Photosystem reaction center subunit H n=2 Tax=Chromobacterium alticapitis TaxID=2073169 RepID=A0A2S5DBB6_9NEIS|nr:photosystem reaction center subunit H [Chromobacterium alticapitis]